MLLFGDGASILHDAKLRLKELVDTFPSEREVWRHFQRPAAARTSRADLLNARWQELMAAG